MTYSEYKAIAEQAEYTHTVRLTQAERDARKQAEMEARKQRFATIRANPYHIVKISDRRYIVIEHNGGNLTDGAFIEYKQVGKPMSWTNAQAYLRTLRDGDNP